MSIFDGTPPSEASAQMRSAAAPLWQFYVACMQEGFTQEQALTLVIAMITRPTAG